MSKRGSEEQILTPLLFTFAQQSHEMTAGMQAEGLGLAGQFHPGFFRRAATLAVVAGMAAGHQIFPGGFARAGTGNHVVERQFARRHKFGAVLAGIAIPHHDVLARKSAGLVRDAAVFEKPDHARHAQRTARGMDGVRGHFLGRSDAFEHQNQRAAGGADIDRFVARVQYQHGLLKSGCGLSHLP